MRLTKIYTKIGDRGTTMLASGETVSKSSLRIEAYGDVDELNACLSILASELALLSAQSSDQYFYELNEKVRMIQNELFDVGGELATPLDVLNIERQQVVSTESTLRLEKQIDLMNQGLQPLANFVIPGGSKANGYAHLCRTVCRRAERNVVKLSEVAPVREEVSIYLNRLSDWLFVLCRTISTHLGTPEILWKQKK